jgi:hypothetical protein
MVEPQRPELVYLGGENRFERGPGMEAPPVYSKADAPPEYGRGLLHKILNTSQDEECIRDWEDTRVP